MTTCPTPTPQINFKSFHTKVCRIVAARLGTRTSKGLSLPCNAARRAILVSLPVSLSVTPAIFSANRQKSSRYRSNNVKEGIRRLQGIQTSQDITTSRQYRYVRSLRERITLRAQRLKLSIPRTSYSAFSPQQVWCKMALQRQRKLTSLTLTRGKNYSQSSCNWKDLTMRLGITKFQQC